jgi:hypothetical protein
MFKQTKDTYVGEEGGSKVEDKVDTGPLLHHLKRGTENGAAQVAVGGPEASSEAVGPGLEVTTLGDDGHLILVVGDNLSELLLDIVRVGGLVTDATKHLGGLGEIALADEVTGRLGKEEETNSKDDGPDELDGDGNAVRARVGAVLSAIVDAGGSHETNGDTELVSRDDGTTDLAGSDFGHVENDDGRDETDTETGNQTANNEESDSGRGDLQGDTNHEDTATADDGSTTTKPIGKITGDDGTEKGTGRENRSDERLVGGRDDIAFWIVDVVGFDLQEDKGSAWE